MSGGPAPPADPPGAADLDLGPGLRPDRPAREHLADVMDEQFDRALARLSPERRSEAREARESLGAFCRQAWDVVEPHDEYRWSWHIDAFVGHLEAVTRGEVQNLVVLVPPRSGKSNHVSVFWPAWWWTFEPGTRFLCASYSGGLATDHSVKCRRLVRSQWYRARFGDAFQLAGDQDRKTQFENDRGGYRIAVGVGGTGTGRGGDVLIVDDPHNVKERESDRKREEVIDWWDTVLSTRLNNPATGRRVVVMQRTHEDDLVGHLEDESPHDWTVLRLPQEYEPDDPCRTRIGFEDPREEEGELLHPERFPREWVEAQKAELGSRDYAAQHQQRPAPAEGAIFKRRWFRFHRFHDLPDGFDVVLQSWDCAFKGKQTSDFVCGQTWGIRGADHYLLGQTHAKLEFTETLDAIRRAKARWQNTDAVVVEDKANGPAVISTLRREIPGMVAFDPGERDKPARYRSVAPTVEAGNVVLPDPEYRTEGGEAPYEWVEDLVAELCRVPEARNDDRADAMAQAILWARERGRQPAAAMV